MKKNSSAVSFKSDRHKTRCSCRRWSTPSDHPPAGGRNKVRVANRSACQTTGTRGTQRVHPAVSSTSVIGLRKHVHHSAQSKFTGSFSDHNNRNLLLRKAVISNAATR